MSENGNKIAERIQKFLEILSKYDIAYVYAHYEDLVVELKHTQKVRSIAEEDKKALNELNAFNDLNPLIWRIFH
jgi:ketosteroid isomerase-like protein